MGPEAVESLVRGHSFKAPSPPRAEGPQTWARTDLNTKSMADPGYTRTHTHTSTCTAAAANAHLKSARERGGFYRYLGPGGGLVEAGSGQP